MQQRTNINLLSEKSIFFKKVNFPQKSLFSEEKYISFSRHFHPASEMELFYDLFSSHSPTLKFIYLLILLSLYHHHLIKAKAEIRIDSFIHQHKLQNP